MLSAGKGFANEASGPGDEPDPDTESRRKGCRVVWLVAEPSGLPVNIRGTRGVVGLGVADEFVLDLVGGVSPSGLSSASEVERRRVGCRSNEGADANGFMSEISSDE